MCTATTTTTTTATAATKKKKSAYTRLVDRVYLLCSRCFYAINLLCSGCSCLLACELTIAYSGQRTVHFGSNDYSNRNLIYCVVQIWFDDFLHSVTSHFISIILFLLATNFERTSTWPTHRTQKRKLQMKRNLIIASSLSRRLAIDAPHSSLVESCGKFYDRETVWWSVAGKCATILKWNFVKTNYFCVMTFSTSIRHRYNQPK